MATAYANMGPYGTSLSVATDATFRLWGQPWTDAIDALMAEPGVTLTQVYSNIDWTTIAYPGANSTTAGQRVYRFNDSLAGTRDVYFSLGFGRGVDGTSSSNDNVAFRITVTVGTGWNGSAITGTTVTSYVNCPKLATNYDQDVLACFVDGLFLMTLNAGAVNYSPFVAIERSRDHNGTTTIDGAVVTLAGGNTNTTGTTITEAPSTAVVDFTRSLTRNAIIQSTAPASAQGSVDVSYSNTNRVYPLHYSAGTSHGLMRSVAFLASASIPVQNQFSVTLGANTYTYRTMGVTGSAPSNYVMAYFWN